MLCTLRDPDIIHCSLTIAHATDATLLAKNSQHCWMFHMASVSTQFLVFESCCTKFEKWSNF